MTSDSMLTTTEAAKLAAVAPSTIKRWADEGILPFSRTAGGHRRFERFAIEEYVRGQARASSGDASPSDSWIRVLTHGQRYDIDSRLLEARGRLGGWFRVADEIGGVLAEMGRRWVSGQLTIAEEHVASDALLRSLTRIGDTLPVRLGGKRSLIVCAGDDDHTLGLSLAELCLREVGVSPVWLGRRTPVAEVSRLVGEGDVDLVVVSASVALTNQADLAQLADDLGAACRAHNVRLVLGGNGAWPETLSYGVRLTSFARFHQYLTEVAA
ncbi:MAG: helix-turn-helix domain-containing protein [Acidobacteria bacterium]|jgi:excisionase family DNA binding protein|nr:helix-turn-helix domain-containing protein [Acidobacteriota bacterium]